MTRKCFFTAASVLTLLAALAFPPHVASGDALCFVEGAPTPVPTRTGTVTLGVCHNNILQVQSVTGGGSPIPQPTQPYSVILTSPLPVPVSLPTSFQTAFPTPIPLPTQPYIVTWPSALPVSGAFPTPIPFPTQPYSVTFPSAQPVTGAFPTPIPRPTDTAGNIIAVTPANYSTPMAVSVAATACPGNCLTVTAPYAGSVSFNITGLTGLGATVTFKASNDNVTFTSVNVVRELNNAVSSTTTTDGIYKIDATNGEYISAQVTTAGSGSMNISYVAKNASSVIKAACVTNCATPIPYPTNSNSVLKTAPDSVNDPCSVPANYLGTAFNLSATDTTIVTHSASTKIYICSFTINNTVATGNTRLRYGTTTTTPCDTGGVNLYNSGLAVDGANYSNAGWPQFVAVPANNDLCITFTGTGGVAAGSVTYVQQ